MQIQIITGSPKLFLSMQKILWKGQRQCDQLFWFLYLRNMDWCAVAVIQTNAMKNTENKRSIANLVKAHRFKNVKKN